MIVAALLHQALPRGPACTSCTVAACKIGNAGRD